MKYLETKHERDSAKLTALITVILVMLLFVMGKTYMDPPEEFGVAVNFGTTEFGQGDVQPLKPIKSEPVNINKPAEVQPTKAEPAKAAESKEDVLTAENAEEIAIKKQKAAETKAKAIADAKAKAEADRLAKEQRELAEKKKKLDALISGVSKSDGTAKGGEGNDNKAGDKGQSDGDPNAGGYYGNGTGNGDNGDYQLGNRKPLSRPKPDYICDEEGLVIVRIEVDVNGKVIKASPGVKGSTNTASCLLTKAQEAALKTKWAPDSNAPSKQFGIIKYRFSLSQ
jgi:outer membrane biosynthesis protein TonB